MYNVCIDSLHGYQILFEKNFKSFWMPKTIEAGYFIWDLCVNK